MTANKLTEIRAALEAVKDEPWEVDSVSGNIWGTDGFVAEVIDEANTEFFFRAPVYLRLLLPVVEAAMELAPAIETYLQIEEIPSDLISVKKRFLEALKALE